jgi:hypothetical protein
MAKPILVINYCIDGMPMSIVTRNLRELQKLVSDSNASEDYYTFLLPVRTDSNIQVFYDKDLDEIHYEELKNMIEEKIKLFEDSVDEIDEDELYMEDEESDIIWDDELTTWEKIKNFFRNIFLGWW